MHFYETVHETGFFKMRQKIYDKILSIGGVGCKFVKEYLCGVIVVVKLYSDKMKDIFAIFHPSKQFQD